ncbi:MAG: putative viral replication protein [Circoviridae sp.]|nr:MAG: putative viral replication protein [Circoviridae sp.]
MASNVVPVVLGVGNTKPPLVNPAIKWVFTLNNYTDNDYKSIKKLCSVYCRCAVIGKEVGEQGTPHLQGYIEFKTKARPKSKFKFTNKIHWEKAQGTKDDNYVYCTKDGDFWTLNMESPYDISLNLLPWQNYIVHRIDSPIDDRRIYWVWDKEGCKGKTLLAKWLFLKRDNVVVLSGKAADMKHGVVEYQNKNGCLPKIVIINIPRSTLDYVSYTGIEEIKDMFFFSGKYEGGMVCGKNPHVLIFANEEPQYDKMSADRWKVYNVDELTGIDIQLTNQDMCEYKQY